MEKLGVIGGMGPEATSYFYDQVIAHTQATSDQGHLDMVILSVASMPDRTHAIETGDDAALLAKMRSCTAALEQLGCAHIAIPCNTSHYFFDQIQASTRVPIIHMPRTTAAEVVRRAQAELGGRRARVGIMGTDGTVAAGIYHRALEEAGAEAVSPAPERQRDVMSLIYDDVKAGREPDLAKLDRVLAGFAQAGCDYVILACTELSVLKRYRAMPARVIDAMDVLVRESIVCSGAPYRP